MFTCLFFSAIWKKQILFELRIIRKNFDVQEFNHQIEKESESKHSDQWVACYVLHPMLLCSHHFSLYFVIRLIFFCVLSSLCGYSFRILS